MRRFTICTLLVPLLAACTVWHASADEAKRISEVLCLHQGSRVADVGAGDGEWTVDLARHVGETGRVWATEVEEDQVEEIRERVEEEGLENVTVVLGDAYDTGLPEDCCDAILLRLVYHHFTDPQPMRDSLRRALKPGGLLAVIDMSPQTHWRELPGVPDRGGHGIPIDDLLEEMTSDGFEVVSRHDDWDRDEEDHYCVVFKASTP